MNHFLLVESQVCLRYRKEPLNHVIGVSSHDSFIEKTDLILESSLSIHEVQGERIVIVKRLDFFILRNEYEFREIRIVDLISVNVKRVDDQGVKRCQQKLVILFQKFGEAPVVNLID